jgi:transcription termination factor Rho
MPNGRIAHTANEKNIRHHSQNSQINMQSHQNTMRNGSSLHRPSSNNAVNASSLQQHAPKKESTTHIKTNLCPTQWGGRRLPFGNLREWDRLRATQVLDSMANEYFRDSQEPLRFSDVYGLNMPQLMELAASLEIDSSIMPHPTQRKRILQLCFQKALDNGTPIAVEGLLVILPDGNGCLVYGNDHYQVSEFSAFIPRCLIRYYALRRGQRLLVHGFWSVNGNVQVICALKLLSVMGKTPQEASSVAQFRDLIPYYPTQRILLESSKNTLAMQNLSMRIVDLLTPIGFGQRGLIVAPPRTGKTMLLQAIANSIATNYPQTHLMVLLIDERPEEVTDFRRMAKGEVFASTFDEYADSHLHVAEMALENARRQVECGEHVVILLDSITRLARAYNAVMPASGRILTGGIDANALQGPKSFFGSARNIEGGGSLTILATALVETGSRMDDVIFEEFKGTGNMELHLDRELAERRIYPAINIPKSGTRKEELLYHPDELDCIHVLHRAMQGVSPSEAMDMIIQRVKKTNSNVEFLMSVNR